MKKLKTDKEIKQAIYNYFLRDFYEKGGDLMYTYRFSAKQNDRDELLKKFDDINKKYSFSDNSVSDLNLTKLQYSAPSEEDITEKAKNSLAEYYKTGVDKINNQNIEKINKINSQIEEEKQNTENSKNNLEKYYVQAKENTSNEALKRGLGRSSIVINKLEAFDRDQIENYIQLDKELTNKLNTLNIEKNTLEAQKETALNNFDIEYALKLSQKIDSIKEEVSNTEKEVVKYNNEIALKEANYKQGVENDRIKNTEKLLEYEKEYGTDSLTEAKLTEKFDLAYNYLMGMSKEDALKALETDTDLQKELAGKAVRLKILMQNRE